MDAILKCKDRVLNLGQQSLFFFTDAIQTNCNCISEALSTEELHEGQRTEETFDLREIALEYTWQELERATRGFSEDRVIGTGHTGRVYRGTLEEGVEAAIKVIEAPFTAGLEEEVRLLSRCRHPNIVMLLGFALEVGYCCAESAVDAEQDTLPALRAEHPQLDESVAGRRECELPCGYEKAAQTSRRFASDQSGFLQNIQLRRCAIVYEFLPGGDAFSRLHDPLKPYPWKDRLRTCIETARGLAHLHKHRPEVFHRDIKTSNILFGEGGSAKIAEFSLACSSTSRQLRWSDVPSLRPNGTIICGAADYIGTAVATEATEIFAFGIVLLEFLVLRPPVALLPNGSMTSLLHLVRPDTPNAKERLLTYVDHRAGWPTSTAAAVAALTLSCVQEDTKRRPKFLECVNILQDIAAAAEVLQDHAVNAEVLPDEGLDLHPQILQESLLEVQMLRGEDSRTTVSLDDLENKCEENCERRKICESAEDTPQAADCLGKISESAEDAPQAADCLDSEWSQVSMIVSDARVGSVHQPPPLLFPESSDDSLPREELRVAEKRQVDEQGRRGQLEEEERRQADEGKRIQELEEKRQAEEERRRKEQEEDERSHQERKRVRAEAQLKLKAVAAVQDISRETTSVASTSPSRSHWRAMEPRATSLPMPGNTTEAVMSFRVSSVDFARASIKLHCDIEAAIKQVILSILSSRSTRHFLDREETWPLGDDWHRTHIQLKHMRRPTRTATWSAGDQWPSRPIEAKDIRIFLSSTSITASKVDCTMTLSRGESVSSVAESLGTADKLANALTEKLKSIAGMRRICSGLLESLRVHDVATLVEQQTKVLSRSCGSTETPPRSDGCSAGGESVQDPGPERSTGEAAAVVYAPHVSGASDRLVFKV